MMCCKSSLEMVLVLSWEQEEDESPVSVCFSGGAKGEVKFVAEF